MITVALRLSLVSGPWSKCRENNPVNSVLECSGAVVQRCWETQRWEDLYKGQQMYEDVGNQLDCR